MEQIIRIILKILYIFPIKNKRICFMSFDGSKLCGDSKAIIDWINENSFDNEMIFLVKDRECQKRLRARNVRFEIYKSLKGILAIMTSKVVVYNISIPYKIPTRKNQILINTWHGMAYKKIGVFTEEFSVKNFARASAVISHSKYYTEEVIRKSFCYKGKVLNIGAPRNDVFFSKKVNVVSEKVREYYNVKGKKILLYAPTFRGNFSNEKIILNFDKMIDILSKKFSGEWVVFYRVHPLLSSSLSDYSDTIIDVSLYDDMQELLCSADILVTDYSSSIWDFSLLKKPIFLFTYDLKEYELDRGLYIDLRTLPFKVSECEKELWENILEFDYEHYKRELMKYFDNTVSYEDGTSTRQLYDFIEKELYHGKKI